MDFKLINIPWDRVIEALKSENIINTLTSTDPLILFSDIHYLLPALGIALFLFFFNFRKTLVFILGCLVFWYACVHELPQNGELQLHDVATFGTTTVAILGVWIYFFFIRAE